MLVSPFAQRAYVYVLGFGCVIVLSTVLSAENFAIYSIVQSVIELAGIIATLGAGFLYTRRSVASGSPVRYKSLFGTVVIGWPISAVLVVILFGAYNIPVDWATTVVCLSVAILAFNQLSIANVKAFDQGFLANNESSLRSISLIIVLIGFWLLVGRPNYQIVLCLGVLGLSVVQVFAFIAHRRYAKISVELNESVLRQFSSLVYSLPSFLIKKFDLLAVGMLANLEFVAAFKIAFLLTEAPFQFVQAYINSNSRSFSSGFSAFIEKVPLFRKVSFLSVFSQFFVLFFLYLYQRYSGLRCFEVGIFLSPYFAMRSLTVFHETLMALSGSISTIKRLLLGLMVVKYLLIYFSSRLGSSEIGFAYLVLIPLELIVFEFFSRRQFQGSVLFRLISFR